MLSLLIFWSTVSIVFGGQSDSLRETFCRDQAGDVVDWWVVYKQPGSGKYSYRSSKDPKNSYSTAKTAPEIFDNIAHHSASPFINTLRRSHPITDRQHNLDSTLAQDNRVLFAWNDEQRCDIFDTESQEESTETVAHSKGIIGLSVEKDEHKDTKGIAKFYLISHTFPDAPNGNLVDSDGLPKMRRFISHDPNELIKKRHSQPGSKGHHAMCISMSQQVDLANGQIMVAKDQVTGGEMNLFSLLEGLSVINPKITVSNYDPSQEKFKLYHQVFGSTDQQRPLFKLPVSVDEIQRSKSQFLSAKLTSTSRQSEITFDVDFKHNKFLADLDNIIAARLAPNSLPKKEGYFGIRYDISIQSPTIAPEQLWPLLTTSNVSIHGRFFNKDPEKPTADASKWFVATLAELCGWHKFASIAGITDLDRGKSATQAGMTFYTDHRGFVGFFEGSKEKESTETEFSSIPLGWFDAFREYEKKRVGSTVHQHKIPASPSSVQSTRMQPGKGPATPTSMNTMASRNTSNLTVTGKSKSTTSATTKTKSGNMGNSTASKGQKLIIKAKVKDVEVVVGKVKTMASSASRTVLKDDPQRKKHTKTTTKATMRVSKELRVEVKPERSKDISQEVKKSKPPSAALNDNDKIGHHQGVSLKIQRSGTTPGVHKTSTRPLVSSKSSPNHTNHNSK